MNTLNDTIFGDIKTDCMNLSTRALFPRNFEDLKQRMIAEYSQISTRKPQTAARGSADLDTLEGDRESENLALADEVLSAWSQ